MPSAPVAVGKEDLRVHEVLGEAEEVVLMEITNVPSYKSVDESKPLAKTIYSRSSVQRTDASFSVVTIHPTHL